MLQGACAGAWSHQQALSSEKAARAWHERLRLVQEALTLLRGLSVQPLLKDLVLESHTSSAASTRACLTTAGKWHLPADLLVVYTDRSCLLRHYIACFWGAEVPFSFSWRRAGAWIYQQNCA